MPQSWRRTVSLTASVLLIALLGFAAGVAVVDGSSQARAEEAKADRAGNQKAPPKAAKAKLKRVGSVVGLNEETMEQYVLLHDHVWPEVLKRIRESNIRNYSIFIGQLDDGRYYLFSYFEYVGDDFDADMSAMVADPVTRDWWKLTDPLQRRVQGTPVGDQWKTMKQVFHTD
jgi:L-rhamnose mutarotase